jgi:hypothetical protein
VTIVSTAIQPAYIVNADEELITIRNRRFARIGYDHTLYFDIR